MKAYVFFLFALVGSLIVGDLHAQTASATWSLSSSTMLTASTTGLVTGSDQVLSPGPAPAISIFDYAGTGQRLWAGTTGWIGGSEDATRYIEFEVTPTPGNDLSVTNISFEYGAAGVINTIVSNARYSADGGASWTLLNPSPLDYQHPSLGFLNMAVNVPVTGSSFLLRIHPWAVQNSVAGSPTFATHNSVRIDATTTPVAVGECITPPSGLVGWWAGDGNTSDFSGDGHTATLMGNAGFTPGMVDSAFDFQGEPDFASVPDAPELDFGAGQDFSMDFWVRSTDIQNWSSAFFTSAPVVLHKFTYTESSATGFIVRILFGHINLQMSTPGGLMTKNSGIQIDDGNWHFVAITVDRDGGAQGGKIVVDDNPAEFFDVSMVQGSLANTSPLTIGQQILPTGPSNVLRKFGGEIDEVELFDRVLTDGEIAALYAAGAEGKCKTGTVEGTKYEDINGNGARDMGEPGMAGVMIDAVSALSGSFSTVTDANGAYSFSLEAESWTLSEVLPTGYVQTAPAGGVHAVVLTPGVTISGLDFGNQEEPVVGEECVAPPQGMVGWWSGDNVATDLSGFGNDGSLQGATTYTTGKVGSAFSLSALGDHVAVPDAPSLNFGPGQDLSIDAWIKTSDRTNIMQIVDKRDSDFFGVFGYSMFVQGGRLAFQIAEVPFGSANYLSTGPIISDGQWHLVAVTLDRDSATGLQLYVDGQLTDTFNPTARDGSLITTTPLYIGTTGYTLFGVSPFVGAIDEVELFNRALSADEIASLFNAGAEGKCPLENENCDATSTTLPLNSGQDHSGGGVYAVGGNDAFWMITADADTSRTVPRPAEVITNVTSIWPASAASSQWIGPSQVEIDNNSIGFEQDNVGLGVYTYALELCIVGETATQLSFNLMLLADNAASVWLRLPDGSRQAVGATPANGFTTPTAIVITLNGVYPPGTYSLEVDVTNDGVSPDFTGMSLTGVVTGANLYMQKHDCCNSDGHITGSKFFDLDGDGVRDKEEEPLSGIIIELLQNGLVVATTTTDSAGDYFFDVAPGTYTVREVVPMGYEQTLPASGSYQVTLGPGEIEPNLDFGNELIPCIEATALFKCKRPEGGRYIELTLTNNGTVPASGVMIASSTPGVSFSVTNTTPAFPLAVGATVVLAIDFTGLAMGASAQMQISLYGMPDGMGMTEACCNDTITVTRPPRSMKFECPIFIDGEVTFTGDVARPIDGWIVRLRDSAGVHRTTMTDEEGAFLFESVPVGDYMLSLDLQFDVRMVEPASGFIALSFKDMESSVDGVRFTVRDEGEHTGTDEGDETLPTEFALEANYPNPFNPSTVIRYALPEVGSVRLEVFDMLGRPVATLVDQVQSQGRYTVAFDASGLSSGMYLYRLTAGSFAETKRMLLIR